MIDRITSRSLKEFKSKFDFGDDISDVDLFEHFINYIILEKKLEDRIDEDALIDVNIGVGGTIGLDGFCILINKQLINSIEDLSEILNSNIKPKAEVFFIQSKTENKFDTKEIGNFGDSVEDFVSIVQKYNWNSNAKSSIELFKFLTDNSNKLESNPTCYMYYCTLGENLGDKNVEAKKEQIITRVEKQRVFGDVNFSYLDYSDIQSSYKKIGQKISRKFNFSLRTLMPEMENVKEAYIGLVPAKTIINLIEEDSELISSIFYDNVRDFQGFNAINSEIKKTIEDDNLKHAFAVLNNGITIVANQLSQSRDDFEISNYQIINGLQTSRVLLSCKDSIDEDMYVALKLIVTEDENLISKIIRATNRQTAVKEEDLIAYTEFQKNLEDFFKSFDDEDKLYYERRSKQYNGTEISPRKIVDKLTLIKTLGSFYFDKPHLATRYFGRLFAELVSVLFKDNHKMYPYYASSFIYKKLEEKFINREIDNKYKKLKYFILMMLRFECNKSKNPPFESNKVENYCKDLISEFNDKDKFNKYIENVILKIDSLNLDLSDGEVSKSSDLVERIKKLYY